MSLAPMAMAGFGSAGTVGILIAYIVIFALLIYFMSYRPSKQRQKKLDSMIAGLSVGDSILTSSGFYGVVIDIADDVVVVEFGSDRHCRIPMQKTAIVSVEKSE